MIETITEVKSVVFNEDCMAGMSRYPDKYFDLAIVDPPYGINMELMGRGNTMGKKRRGRLNSGGGKLKNRLLNKSSIDWDNEIPTDEYFEELFRISNNQIIWGANYFDLPPTRGIIFWDKVQPFENFSQFELGWTSFDCPAKKYENCNRAGVESKGKIHPTQKPISLYKWLLKTFAKEGDKILDTHLGSQSSRIAAYDMGFDFTGFELDKDYFDAGNKRFNNFKAQAKLF